MALTSGIHVGSYQILGTIGAGGMGEVYRARDTKLGRDVAIKVLPDFFASDPDRLARFQREAHVLASLNDADLFAPGLLRFSPDGKWLAHAAGDLTVSSIYVSAFGDAGRRWRVDADGGYMPAWSPKGRELFFLGGAQRNRLMVVEVERAGDGLQPSKPRLLLEQSMGGGIGFGLRRYDVTSDGQRFVFATAENAGAPTEIRVVLDWRSQVERLLAPK